MRAFIPALLALVFAGGLMITADHPDAPTWRDATAHAHAVAENPCDPTRSPAGFPGDCNDDFHKHPPVLTPETANAYGLTIHEKITSRAWNRALSSRIRSLMTESSSDEIWEQRRKIRETLTDLATELRDLSPNSPESSAKKNAIGARLAELTTRPEYRPGFRRFLAGRLESGFEFFFTGNADKVAKNLTGLRDHPETCIPEFAEVSTPLLSELRAAILEVIPTAPQFRADPANFSLRFGADLRKLGAEGFARLLRAGYFNEAQDLLDQELPQVEDEMENLSPEESQALRMHWAGPNTGGIISSPLGNLTNFSERFGFQPGQTLIDIGSGHGNPGIALGSLNPGLQFTGYDFVKPKVDGANRLANALGLTNVRFIQQDLSDPEFQLPLANYYYFFNPANPPVVERMVKQIKRHAKAGAPVKVIVISGGWVPEILERQGFSVRSEPSFSFRVYSYTKH